VYEKIVSYKRKFKKKLEKIPRPEFIVLYNGKEKFPNYKELRLSDAFMDVQGLKQSESGIPPLELIVQVYNINQGYNQEILNKSVTLDSYSILISKIWEFRNKKIILEEAIKLAIKYCMDNNVLKDYLKKHGSEVYSMLYGEYNIEDEIEVVREEVREETWNECSKHERQKFLELLNQGLSAEEIKQRLAVT